MWYAMGVMLKSQKVLKHLGIVYKIIKQMNHRKIRFNTRNIVI